MPARRSPRSRSWPRRWAGPRRPARTSGTAVPRCRRPCIGGRTPTPATTLLRGVAAGAVRVAVALAPERRRTCGPILPFRIDALDGGSTLLDGRAEFVVDARRGRPVAAAGGRHPGRRCWSSSTSTPAAVDDRSTSPSSTRPGASARGGADGVAVDEASIWRFDGDDPRPLAQRLVDRGAVAVACDSLGVSRRDARRHRRLRPARRQFDRPIGSFQAVKHACADMLVQLAVGRELLAAAVDAVAAERAGRRRSRCRGPSRTCAPRRSTSSARRCSSTAASATRGRAASTCYLKRAVLNRALFGSPAAHRTTPGVRIDRDALRSEQSLTSVVASDVELRRRS